ncbi:MAG: LicD family protein [Erysipelotrichaceae bacterium]|nr:LicD family protein [Erysipelotrichaceae bacterium]
MTEKDYGSMVISNGVTVRELQKKMLEIFRYFQQLCQDNGLRYWAAGGTLIGAVRHHGFIPWDDDIDVFMPRRDYERLYELWPAIGDNENYALLRTDERVNIHNTDMQLADRNTTFINRHSVDEDIVHGVSIDIMPFDGCPDGLIGRAWQIYHAVMFGIFNVQRLPDHQGKLLRLATSAVLNSVKNPEKRYQIWKKHEKAMSRYDFDKAGEAKELVTSFRALFWPHPRRSFDLIEADFEDLKITIPAGYDGYLRRIYGDYLSFPPEEERTAKHDIVFMDLNHGYQQYRGIHYCVRKQEK